MLQALDVFQYPDGFAIVLPYLAFESLRYYLQERSLFIEEAKTVAVQMLLGVEDPIETRIIRRAVEPSDMLVDSVQLWLRITITDFHLAASQAYPKQRSFEGKSVRVSTEPRDSLILAAFIAQTEQIEQLAKSDVRVPLRALDLLERKRLQGYDEISMRRWRESEGSLIKYSLSSRDAITVNQRREAFICLTVGSL